MASENFEQSSTALLQFLMKRPKFNTQFSEMMNYMMDQIMQKVISKVQNALDITPKNDELLAQIDCVLILNAGGELTNSIRYKYNQENHPKKFHSNNLDNLLKYYKKEILDSKYQQLVKNYPALESLLKVEEHGIKS
ncbi:15940_t:CDS:2 [Funneliformis caledonium]|uniref:15940_t:CDS:1 n=1 Tax=Funneliformis caledonium TaxID=1117310 RepID=A0A9N9EWD4_9GLOM|nr:15940_t:CDS:2 [Funneliformis caledonium]